MVELRWMEHNTVRVSVSFEVYFGIATEDTVGYWITAAGEVHIGMVTVNGKEYCTYHTYRYLFNIRPDGH